MPTDKPGETPIIERVREWLHAPTPGTGVIPTGHPSDAAAGPICARRNRPVYTEPQQIPNPCGDTKKGPDYRGCGSQEWLSNGIVRRDVKSGQIVLREKST